MCTLIYLIFFLFIVLGIQKKVNEIFCDFCESVSDVPFLEFSEDGVKEKCKLLVRFAEEAKQTGVKHVVKMAFELEDQKLFNPSLVQSALAIFLTHNEEARRLGVVVPPLALRSIIKRAHERKPYPVTPDTLQGPELLAYFREDYDLNDHHNHWHSVFPVGGIPNDKGVLKRRIKRQGELFLYMHSQMLARYNAELYAWDLDPTHAFNFDDILQFGYTPPPGLLDTYSPRPADRGWFEKNNPIVPDNTMPSKDEMYRCRDNILRDIAQGKFKTVDVSGAAGEYLLTEENAMNTIGFVVEALSSDLQEVRTGVKTDRSQYGSLHNNGHNKFAEIGYTKANPKFGVMGYVEVAVRDHVFWLWHRNIDDFRRIIVNKYTHDLNTYKADAEILDLQIKSRKPNSQTPTGGIATYLDPPNTDRDEVNAKLRHEPYEWKITVKSTLDPPPNQPQSFTVRLFIALETQIEDLSSWIEMDKFTVSLTQQQETLTRKDLDSSVSRKVRALMSDSRCSCGWPQNLMLPVGKPSGLSYVAFAMLTKGELGQVSVIMVVL